MVALDFRHVIGLGSREQRLVDARTAQQPRHDAAAAVAKALQDGLHRQPRIVKGIAPGKERAQNVDQDDLARTAAKMIFVKTADGLALVHFKAIRHQGAQRSGDRLHTDGNIERCKPQIGHLSDVAGAEETAWLQETQSVAVAHVPQEGAIEIVRLARDLFARDFVVPMLADIGHESAASLSTYATAIVPQGGARPFRISLPEKRQVQEPLSRIVDNPDRRRGWNPADPPHELADSAGRYEMHVDPDFADVIRSRRPVGRTLGHDLDMVE